MRLRRHRSQLPALLALGVLCVALNYCLSRTAVGHVTAGVPADHVAIEELRFQTSAAVSSMLIGGFAFMMALFYLVNNADPEIRMYSWKVISSTVNIFSAVLIFAAINRLVKHLLLDGAHEDHMRIDGYTVGVDFAQMLAWIGAMLFVLWYAARRARQLYEKKDCEHAAHKHHLDVKCWAMLFAHTAGFAAINCFGVLQQGFFSQSPMRAFLVVPLTAASLSLLFWILGRIGRALRRRRMLQLGAHFFQLWEDEAEEAENDTAALALSFLTCQALRFQTGGVLPDLEGEEPPATPSGFLLACSLLFAAIAVVSVFCLELKHEALKARPYLHRSSEVFQLVCCMCCAWCSYYGMKRLVFSLQRHDGEEDQTMTEEVLRIVLAVLLSFCAFLLIFALNWIVDREKMLEAKEAELMAQARAAGKVVKVYSGVDHSGIQLLRSKSGNTEIKSTALQRKLVLQGSMTLIKAMAILVGFSWEQAFDLSVNQTCAQFTYISTAWAELLFAALMVAMVLPAWRLYILPNAEGHPRISSVDSEMCSSRWSSRQVSKDL
eukprot:TRINITY_DN52184_c0_g1_i1.p1 TRINITY_DN52184_c0_g1~~TRINITY_DN52184_c0_g1_i1.p1  ORF type:complete len:549 (+),score=94.90 TRINITY_DN52184_c0_g1_i1:28-1674(+)